MSAMKLAALLAMIMAIALAGHAASSKTIHPSEAGKLMSAGALAPSPIVVARPDGKLRSSRDRNTTIAEPTEERMPGPLAEAEALLLSQQYFQRMAASMMKEDVDALLQALENAQAVNADVNKALQLQKSIGPKGQSGGPSRTKEQIWMDDTNGQEPSLSRRIPTDDVSHDELIADKFIWAMGIPPQPPQLESKDGVNFLFHTVMMDDGVALRLEIPASRPPIVGALYSKLEDIPKNLEKANMKTYIHEGILPETAESLFNLLEAKPKNLFMAAFNILFTTRDVAIRRHFPDWYKNNGVQIEDLKLYFPQDAPAIEYYKEQYRIFCEFIEAFAQRMPEV